MGSKYCRSNRKRLKSLRLLSYWWRNDLLENAIFKIDSALLFDEKQIQNIIKESNSEIVTVSRDFFDFKVGKRSDINDLYNKLKPFGIMQFVRSGRISVSKEKMQISLLLEELKK
jgi:acetolactate synthase-1/3 small subunit